MERILVVEDTDSLREVITTVLESEGYKVDATSHAEEALRKLNTVAYACILSDFKLPGKNGLDLLREVRENLPNLPFLIMTAYGSVDIAVEAMKLGANDFITKPFEPTSLCAMLREVIEHRRIITRASGLRTRRERTLVSKDVEMQRVLKQAKKAAPVDTSILILGESGTGKELVARYIHDHSRRADKPFVAVNCAAMPPELLESEFFGHEAGSFTGATQTRIGVFELASEGTIFLDEVGDMPTALQVKLLRSIQEREVKRVGGSRTIKVNPRIVAATNQNIFDALEKGAMREDFYYRIAVITLTLPPLRARIGDVDLLTEHYVDYFCNAIGKHTLAIEDAARELLHTYGWPGNARELENVIERAVILAEDVIRPEHLGIRPTYGGPGGTVSEDGTALSLPEIANRAMRDAEVDLITRTLRQTKGNKSKAAEILGVSYKTLLNKVKEYNLSL